MSAIPPLSIDIRSYREDDGADRHGFAQLVLPLSGALEMEIGGRGGRLAPGRGAFVDIDTWHSEMSERPNRSLIVDLGPAVLAGGIGERLAAQPYLALNPAASKLVDYMGLQLAGGGSPALQLWVPLLLDTVIREAPRPQSRLAALMAAIEAEPGLAWTTEAMAKRAAMSVSRLHAVFREELDTTPRAFLADARLKRVGEWLVQSDRSIAEIAFRAGFSDQSALTRAMRKATGLTPAAYRRRNRETGPKVR